MNITYLLGAGASFEALPIVADIPSKLENFADQFYIYDFDKVIKNEQKSRIAEKHLFRFNSIEDQRIEYEKIKNFHNDIIWLKEESGKHSSIDTFAKKLYLQGNSDLKKLKYILSCFFEHEQTYNFDKRYDSFFASILDDLSKLPENLKILSWNYDSQLEIAFSRFTNFNVEKCRTNLNVLSKDAKNFSTMNNNVFSVFKVNGTTSIKSQKDENYDLIIDYDVDKVSLVSNFLEIYSSKKLFSTHIPNMSFAWENFNEESNFHKALKESISQTDALIVIGYSFPFFNRKVDKFILDSMSNLNKIYVQDPNNAEDIIEKIKGIIPLYNTKFQYKNRIEFKPVTFKDQFFIPIEF